MWDGTINTVGDKIQTRQLKRHKKKMKSLLRYLAD